MFLFERKNSGSKHLTDLGESFQHVDLVQVVGVYELMFQIQNFMRKIKQKLSLRLNSFSHLGC